MGPNFLLLCRREHKIFPFPEPDQSDPRSPFYFLNSHLYIILPSTSRSSKWSLSLRFPHQSTVWVSKKLTGYLNTLTIVADILLLFMHHFKSGHFIYVHRDMQYGFHSAPSPWISRAPWLGQVGGGVSLTARPILYLRGVDNDKSAFTFNVCLYKCTAQACNNTSWTARTWRWRHYALSKSLCVVPIICQSKGRNTPEDMKRIIIMCPTREVGAKGDIWS